MKLISGLVFIILFFISCGKTNHKEPKIWSPNNLNWSDFNKMRSVPDGYSVQIYTGIECPLMITEANDAIYAYMDLNKSIFEKGLSDSSGVLLKHEQYHFNITEYFARVIRKNVVEIGIENLTSARLKTVFEFYIDEKNSFQVDYDESTNHGLINESQLLWEKKIDSLLFTVKEYTNINIYEYTDFAYGLD